MEHCVICDQPERFEVWSTINGEEVPGSRSTVFYRVIPWRGMTAHWNCAADIDRDEWDHHVDMMIGDAACFLLDQPR